MRRLKSLFTVLLALWSTIVFAEDVTINGIKYSVDTETKQATVIEGGSYSGDIVIPVAVEYNDITYSVTSIGNMAFFDCSELTSITIPNNLTTIGEYAFADCSGLTSITIPNNLTTIGDCAFSGCFGLVNITVEDSNTNYDSRENCNAIIETATNTLIAGCKNTVIPNSVTSIEKEAFWGCSALTSITIPNSVTTIGDYAFAACSSLASITINNSVMTIGEGAFYDCICLTSIKIPNSVTSIGNYVFNGCSGLKELHLEDGTETLSLGYNYYNSSGIGKGLFYNCPLETIYLGRNLSYSTDKNEGYSPFYNNTLTSVTIGNSVTTIGEGAFRDCYGLKTVYNLSNLTFTKGETYYGYVAYYADIVINAPNGSINGNFVFGVINDVKTLVAYLGNDAEIVLPDSEENYAIGTSVFEGSTSITSVTIPNSVTTIGENAFSYCSELTSVTIPNSVTSIGDKAFYKCTNLANITIPNGVTTIGEYAFQYCSAITSITIPNSVTNIEKYAFSWCDSVTSITVADDNTVYDSRENCNAIIETATNTLIVGCKKSVILSNITTIGTDAFSGCSFTDITIPNSVTAIEDWAFSGCSGLTSVSIPNSVTSIGDYAFYDCSGLTSITIPNSITSIGSGAFYGTAWYNNQQMVLYMQVKYYMDIRV